MKKPLQPIYLVFLLAAISIVPAKELSAQQRPMHPPPGHMHPPGDTLNKQTPADREAALRELKELRKNLLTAKLGLTEEEKNRFIPVYEEFREKENQLALNFRAKYRKRDLALLTEEEAKIYLSDLGSMRDEQHQLQRTYYVRFLTLIPAKKLVLLQRAEREIQQEIVKRSRELRPNKPPGGPGREKP
jgi:hypothetical protein